MLAVHIIFYRLSIKGRKWRFTSSHKSRQAKNSALISESNPFGKLSVITTIYLRILCAYHEDRKLWAWKEYKNIWKSRYNRNTIEFFTTPLNALLNLYYAVAHHAWYYLNSTLVVSVISAKSQLSLFYLKNVCAELTVTGVTF